MKYYVLTYRSKNSRGVSKYVASLKQRGTKNREIRLNVSRENLTDLVTTILQLPIKGITASCHFYSAEFICGSKQDRDRIAQEINKITGKW